MHLIDQELSGINQLGAIVVAISGYLCGKQLGQLCLTVDRLIVCGKKKRKKKKTVCKERYGYSAWKLEKKALWFSLSFSEQKKK